MTEISGSLKLVTGSPAAVSQVWLRAPNGRVQGSEYVTEAPDTVPVTGGAVSFDALPGAMVMTLVSHGAPMHTVKLLVPDKTSATLAECIEAAELATDGTRSALERLALEVQAELGQVPSLVSDALAQDATIIDAVRQVVSSYTGTGSPEGKVSAPVGSTYTDSAATNGAIRWIKASGAGSTGWRVEYGDTGWRDVTSLMPAPPIGGFLRVRRVPNILYLQTSWLNTGSEGFTVELGDQWSPIANSGGELVASGGRKAGYFRFTFSGRLVVKKTTSSSLDGVVMLLPSNRWPISYIGTPA